MDNGITLCKHFNDCGGCDLQDKAYGEQLSLKQERIKALFSDVGACRIDEIVPSPEVWHYRNKMEYIVGSFDDTVSIGLRRKKNFRRIVDLGECRIFYREVAGIFSLVKEWIKESGIQPYHLMRRTGTLRYVGLRHSKFYDEMMAVIVVSSSPEALQSEWGIYQALAEKLKALGKIRSVYLCTNNRVADVAITGEMRLLYGQEAIRERLNGIDYLIDPLVFFQTNPFCCNRLYEIIKREALAGGKLDAIDLYCGSGGIALQVADSFRKVTGIDISPKNIDDAVRNARLNDIKNTEFIVCDADSFLMKLGEAGGLKSVSTLIVDPPRAGLTKKGRSAISSSGIGTVIYVSCNPDNLKEDLKRLLPFYRVEKIIPVDMFPQTRHVEVVAVLKNIQEKE